MSEIIPGIYLRTEEEYEKSLERIKDFFGNGKYTDEEEAIFSAVLIYEDEHYPMGEPSFVDQFKFRMDQQFGLVFKEDIDAEESY